MSAPFRSRPQWQLQAIAAQRRDQELRKAEELQRVANYFESNTNKSRHHEQWTTDGYYQRANKEAELLSERKIREAQLEERRKKLELMLFQENMQYQQEMKKLASQPKLYKNGSYLNNVPTSTLKEINQGIMEKEEQLRKHEAELRLHHAWRLRQPELRAVSQYIANGKLKSAWMEQLVEKEVQKKKEEEEERKLLQERDAELRKQIEIEEERLKEKEMKIKDLRESLEDQIAEMSEKETIVKRLRQQEEKERLILDELQFISKEREREHTRLVSERDASIVNMGLHKYKLKRKVLAVMKEIELDLVMLERIKRAVLKDMESEKEKSVSYKWVLDAALAELEEHRERERQRQRNIEAMYDGEARQINEKQDKTWAKEREAREILMKDVVNTLKRQVEEKIEENRQKQKENVLEREKILDQLDSFHQEVKVNERETQLRNSSYSTMNALQSQLNSLRVQSGQLEAAREREAGLREAVAQEATLRKEISRMHREGSTQDMESEKEKSVSYKWVLDAALAELEEHRERERQRQRNIEAMYDGEARQINEKQDKTWAKEREAREILMKDVVNTLKRQVEEKIEENRQKQKENVLEREKILDQLDSFHQEVKVNERETQLRNSSYSTMNALQSQLNSLRVQSGQLEAAREREAGLREAVAQEATLRKEISRMHREGSTQAWT